MFGTPTADVILTIAKREHYIYFGPPAPAGPSPEKKTTRVKTPERGQGVPTAGRGRVGTGWWLCRVMYAGRTAVSDNAWNSAGRAQ